MDEARFKRLISGASQGAGANFARGVLWLLSFLYGGITRLRNFSYEVKWLRTHKPKCTVISVGNITTGGTGKTPVVSYIANWYHRNNFKVVLVSRGYHQLAESVNDEKLVLDRLCPGIPHILNKDRVAAVEEAIAEHDAEVVVLDDGFQHRRLGRHLNIALLDMSAPFGYGYVLPRGMLRENVNGLQRADLVLLTRVNQANATEIKQTQETQKQIRETGLTKQERKKKTKMNRLTAVEVSFPPERFLNASGASADIEKLKSLKVSAFCGIGNPDSFRNSLKNLGLNVEHFKAFPDHHHYKEEELDEFAARSKKMGCEAIMVTLKDLVKIEKDEWKKLPLWAVTTGVHFESGRELLDKALDDLAEKILDKRELKKEAAKLKQSKTAN